MSVLTSAAPFALIAALGLAFSAAADTPAASWPHVTSAIAPDAKMEARIARIVKGMTLRQKIAQMTQVEIKTVDPVDIKTYQFGAVLNGGGSWPNMDRHASARDWVRMADALNAQAKIPLLWGTDAVHGDSNVYGATLFPHNIGLGAAHDPELITQIGQATARAVRATGVNWAFAPTVAIVEDERWGRAYEGFSSDPQLVRAYGAAYTQGLQGDFTKPGDVVATAKHFMADGATDDGVNEGNAAVSESDMADIQAQGYYGAIGAGVQTVMASYSGWTDAANGKAPGKAYGKMTADTYLLSDVLKDKIGFDGFVVSDWNAIAEIPGCTIDHCPPAINAGIDMVMVPFDWKKFIDNTVADVQAGTIAQSRIDDAVTRILRVKMRAHLFGHRPSDNPYAGKASALLARDLGRRAVAESLVLLKNNGSALPLKAGAKILVVGKNADSLADQAGGWSISWQGTSNTNADFPNADSLLTAIKAADKGGSVTYSPTGTDVDVSQFDAVIAVIGEMPYAETAGDLRPGTSLAHTSRYPEDLKALQAVSGKGKPVITVFESGRTVYANDLIDASDAFVAAWLPGSEGKGVTDVLFGAKDFRGTLPFAWPGQPCEGAPLFPVGYGLSYAKPAATAGLTVDTVTGCPIHGQAHARSHS